MPNLERQRKRECFQAECRYVGRCKIYLGNDCKELFGDKIPSMVNSNLARPIPEPELVTKFKPFFMEATNEADMEEAL